jgi:hypothetical protein
LNQWIISVKLKSKVFSEFDEILWWFIIPKSSMIIHISLDLGIINSIEFIEYFTLNNNFEFSWYILAKFINKVFHGIHGIWISYLKIWKSSYSRLKSYRFDEVIILIESMIPMISISSNIISWIPWNILLWSLTDIIIELIN